MTEPHDGLTCPGCGSDEYRELTCHGLILRPAVYRFCGGCLATVYLGDAESDRRDRTVACPTCSAPVGERCTTRTGGPRENCHGERREYALKPAGALERLRQGVEKAEQDVAFAEGYLAHAGRLLAMWRAEWEAFEQTAADELAGELDGGWAA